MANARVVRIEGKGGPEVLSIADREIRAPGPSEVRIDVRAAGLNRADSLQRRGFYPAPPGAPADVPGLEFAGYVESIGEAVLSYSVGDRVMGICAGGGMSTLLVAHERELVPVPPGMSFEHAAAIPEVFFTAFDALFLQAEIGLGSDVLIHSVGSGVGTAALQLVRVAGGRSIGTSRTEAKLTRAMELGLEHGIVVDGSQFAAAVKGAVPRGATAILDTVGASYLEENVEAVAVGGTIVTIGLLGGAKGTIPLGALLAKRASLRGSTLRARPLEEKAALAARFRSELLPLFERGLLRPIVEDVMPMARVRDAHARLEANETFGKLVLHW